MSSSPTAKISYHMRVWIDVETRECDKHSFGVSKMMTRLLRHDRSVHREDDGTVEFKILAPMFASQFESSPYWSIRTWLKFLQREGGHKKRFQHCLDPCSAETLLYFPAMQGHFEGSQIDPALHENVLLPSDFAEYICHVGSSHDMHHHPIRIDSGWKRCQEIETDGILHSRESYARTSTQAAG